MVLGKTVQAIAATELMARHFRVQRVRVLSPTSLKHQWQRDIARFAGREAHVVQAWSPELLIVDNAQRVKNWNTVAARALKRIDSP